jgi:redox-sensitive bicupin YhaK (pirin superfamily)
LTRLDFGKHVVHELSQGRRVCLYVAHGEVTLDDVVLSTDDGAGLTAERAASLTANETAEPILLDLGVELP